MEEGADLKKMRLWVQRLLSGKIKLKPVRTSAIVSSKFQSESDTSHRSDEL